METLPLRKKKAEGPLGPPPPPLWKHTTAEQGQKAVESGGRNLGTRRRSLIWRLWTGIPVGVDPEQTTGALVVVLFTHYLSPPPVLCFHGATECMHSLTPHRAIWAPGVDSHLRNLWELKNTHISNCAAHTGQRKPCPPDPHPLLLPVGPFFFV